MKRLLVGSFSLSLLCTAFLFAMLASAQQKAQTVSPRTPAYDMGRELSVQGTAVSFTKNSNVPPLGPHVVLQISSGSLDIHLGNARVLEANRFTLTPGDTVRVIGENVNLSGKTQFVARLIQKGNQALLLRSPLGFPLQPLVKGERGAL